MHQSIRAAVVGVVCAAAFVTAGRQADASTIRHDRTHTEYRDLAALFPAVGTATGSHYCSGTLIAPDVFLTAAHCPSPTTVRVGGGSYAVAERIVHPDYTGSVLGGFDFQILKLAAPVLNVTPAPLYTGRDEVGSRVVSVGFGGGGTGLTGATSGVGTKRAFTNIVDVTGSIYGNSNSEVLLMDFDQPGDTSVSRWGSTIPTDLEGQVAGGDSGGGLFIEIDDVFHLAGVTSFSMDFPGEDGIAGNYGDQSGYSRVSGSLDFIAAHVPEPSMGMAAGVLLGMSLLRRRRIGAH